MKWEDLNEQIYGTDGYGCDVCEKDDRYPKKDKCHHPDDLCHRLDKTVSYLSDRVLTLEQKTEWLTHEKWPNKQDKCKPIKEEAIDKAAKIIFG